MKLTLANVAHEIRNSLGGIELFTDILSEELSSKDNKQSGGAPNRLAIAHLKKRNI